MSGVLLNVFLNWILIYGNLGAPAMGINGAGLATLLSRIAVMCGMLVYPAFERSLSAAWPSDWLAPGLFEEAWNLLKMGIHTGGLNLCEVNSRHKVFELRNARSHERRLGLIPSGNWLLK